MGDGSFLADGRGAREPRRLSHRVRHVAGLLRVGGLETCPHRC